MALSFFLIWCILSLVLGGNAANSSWHGWPYLTFQTGDWQPPHLSLRKLSSYDPGKIFISVRNDNEDLGTAPTIYDNNGDLVWQGPHEKSMDFKMQKLFGEDVITYWDGETGVLGYGYGQVHILDNTYREIYTVTLKDDSLLTPNEVPRVSYVDVHEHTITPNNTMIISAINIRQTDLGDMPGGRDGMWIVDSLFYEIDIKTNEVLFKWDALENLERFSPKFSKRRVWGGDSPAHPWDCYHMNSIHPVKDGYLVSIRYFWSVFYLNKDGSVRWQLSGANDGDGDFDSQGVEFSWQHDARVWNETDDSLILTVFNNAATLRDTDMESTGVAIKVDLQHKKATMLYNATDPTDPITTNTQGSFQFLDAPEKGHFLVGYGNKAKFKEYNDGKVVLAGHFGGRFAQAYRIFKFPWHATPYWHPRIKVRHSSVYTTDVYMSWNGATDYDNWAVYFVPSENSTYRDGRLVATLPRRGFETHVSLEGTSADVRYIVAVARQGARHLRSSPVVDFAR